MNTLLIATHRYLTQNELGIPLEGEWQIYFASNGIAASDMLERLNPQALIIDLNLPYRDGLSILVEHFPQLPPVTVAISDYIGQNEEATLRSLGVREIFELPCSQYDVGRHISTQNLTRLGVNTTCGLHLYKLGIHMKNDGYNYLYKAIPFCATSGAMRFQKELYPEVMRQCGASSVECVEHSIRFTIKEAWKHRDPKVWEVYFPNSNAPDAKCPTCKEFITTLARML